MTDPSIAYSRAQREAHAEQCILWAAAGSWLPLTSCTKIAETYGVPHIIAQLKDMKRGLFPEFICNGESK
jgi:hypothetical protein